MYTNRNELDDILKHLADASDLHKAVDLPTARKQYHSFANSSAVLFQGLRKDSRNLALEIFECPMVDRAIPGVPKKGRWIQAAGRPLENPYMGAEMLECGVRVKP